MSVDCPKCHVPTKSFNLEADLMIERCDTCKGYWLDDGEMERSVGSIQGMPDFHAMLVAAKPLTLACPKCPDKKLVEIPFQANMNPLLIDYCKACKGIWLDGKEFAAVRNMLRENRINLRKARAGGKT